MCCLWRLEAGHSKMTDESEEEEDGRELPEVKTEEVSLDH